ncbi:MAG: ABC transporter permease subunit [Sedimentisphaerales bacterium]|nr:ABC transporter permease subunit [Sedimentisphaerales bacterium]
MKAESINLFLDFFNPARIFGPIFDKELRVSSRRKRNYLLRSAYIILLAVFILFMWLSVIGAGSKSSAIFQASRSSQIGKNAIIAIVWFQFIASQILAIVMLSSSISDEIRTGTLNVLMTTPVSSFKIVTGKLLSKLLQVLLLLAMSLPLLAIMRVFGGIPWNYVVFGLFITLTSVIFAGSLSLFLSIFNRYPYRVIILIFVGYFFIFGLLPFLCTQLSFSNSEVLAIFVNVNPFLAMVAAAEQKPANSINILIHCMIMLSASAVLLVFSIWKVRSAAFRDMIVRRKNIESKVLIKDVEDSERKHYYEYSDYIRKVYGIPIIWKERYCGNEYSERIIRVIGNPIVWKENYGYFFGKGKIDKIVTITIYLLCIFGIMLLLVLRNRLSIVMLSFTISGLYLILMLRLAISIAGSIAGEKEARTLPILLVTPLEDKDIILSKVKAALMRNISLLALYFVLRFFIYFSYSSQGIIRFSQIIYQIPISAASIISRVLFIVGCGAYFGVRMKNSMAAVIATIGIFLVEFILNYLFVLIFVRLMTPFSVAYYNIASIFVMTAVYTAAGLYLLKLSIQKLRCNIF